MGIAVTVMEDERLTCTVAVECPFSDIPTDREIKSELYNGGHRFGRLIGYDVHEWGTFNTKKTRNGIVYGVRVEYRKI